MLNEQKCCTTKTSNPDVNSDFEREASKPELDASITSIANRKGYISYNVTKKQIQTYGRSYLADLYEIDIKGKTKNGEEETNIFAKAIISGNKITIMSVDKAYEKESFAYNDLFKIYTTLQIEASVPLEERFRTPKSYEETNKKAIFLENLKKKGYTACDQKECVTLQVAELSIKQLAKFHSLSYVVQNKMPEYFRIKLRTLSNTYDYIFGDWGKFILNMYRLSSQVLNDEMKKKVNEYIPKLLERLQELMQETTSIGCSLCHGDYRASNLLMVTDGGITTDVIPVDYQTIQYGCPLTDFIYFIYNSTDQRFRKEHMTHLKDLYYETMERFLSQYFKLDVNNIYPREEFELQFQRKQEYGLIIGLLFLPFNFTSVDETPDLSKEDLASVDFALDDRFGTRLTEIVEDFIQRGVL